MAFGTCRLCGAHRQLIKAHIIPLSFLDGTKPLALFDGSAESPPQRALVGPYDETILCDPCDNELGRLDEYALLNIVRTPTRKKTFQDGESIFEYSQLDAFQIYRFMLSVCWRASVSSQKYFREINLGPYEDKIRNEFMQTTPSSFGFDVYVSEFDTDLLPYLQPKSIRMDNINMVLIYAKRFKIWIKTDKRDFLIPPKNKKLLPGSSVFSAVESWVWSEERKSTQKILASNPRPRFWK
jgi:hypothetical protein